MIENNLKEIAKFIRFLILDSTTRAESGHLTSCLSAVELMVGLFFSGIFKYDIENPENPNNDRIIFSKGHAAPLLYSLFAVAGAIEIKKLKDLRKFSSPLEGHPTSRFPFAEVATGSLGQGLSIGLGMALNAKYLDKTPYKTFVLLGDSEMSEGENWEAIQIAKHYCLNNLIGIIDVNRLGQRGETMYGHNLDAYKQRISAFGWDTQEIDGHSFKEIITALEKSLNNKNSPTMVIAKTKKGKGISLIEDKENWHSKTLSEKQLNDALKDFGSINFEIRGKIKKPENLQSTKLTHQFTQNNKLINTKKYKNISTKKAFGISLAKLGYTNPDIILLDAEVSNSTHADIFKKHHPRKFFEMYVAEQNMVGTALGLSKRGKIPFVSTFAAFFTRAYDQIRMAQYSNANLKIIGSYAGVSIGKDGPSQMGLEDIAMMRAIGGSVVLYPSDAVSTGKLIELSLKHFGIVYLRLTREVTALIYSEKENFELGGSKTIRKSNNDQLTLIGAGITLHESLKAYKVLRKKGINIRVVDLYSIKPVDKETLKKAAKETLKILVVEDHHPEGGIAETVRSALFKEKVEIHSLAVRRKEMSGSVQDLLDYEDISSEDIVRKIKLMLR